MSIIDQLYGEGKTSPRKSSILDKVYNEQTPEQAYEAERQGLAAISGEMPGAAWRGMQGAYLNLGNLGRKLVGADTSENDAILAQLQAERDALKAKYGDNFAFDFAEGVGGMGGTIPLDIATGGISKALLVPRLISKALPYMERIPGFALGMMGRMGAEGSVKQVPDPGSLASSLERTLNTVTGGAEGLAEGILYGRAGEIGAEGNIVSRLAKQVPTQGLLGGSMAAYEAAKEGRLPTEGELARGAGFGAGLGAGFATIGGRRERQRPGIIDANEYRQRLAGLLDEENLPPTIQDFPPGAIAGGSGQSILRSLPGGAVEGVAGQSVPRSFPGARAGGSGQSEFLRIPPGAKEGGSGQEDLGHPAYATENRIVKVEKATLAEFESSPPPGYRIKTLPGEDIARAESDGTISLDPNKFFGHGEKDRMDIIAHEKAHFLEEKIPPDVKARLFDDPVVMGYRGRNINEKLANMIQDGKLPQELKGYVEGSGGAGEGGQPPKGGEGAPPSGGGPPKQYTKTLWAKKEAFKILDKVKGTEEDSPGTTLYANPLQPLISGVGNMVKGVLDKMVAPAIGGMPGESFGHTFTRTVQNSMLGLKDWEDSVAKRTGQTIDKAQSAYFTEERMHGKIADKIEAMDRGYVQPFIKLMAETSKNLNTSLDEFDLFLKARYARTGNAIIEKRNPDLYAKGGTRHGMTNDQADQLLAQFKAEGKTKAFENLAKIIYQMQDFKLKLIEKYGLETPEIIQSMRDTHGEYYVPAKGKSGEPSLPGKGAGLDIKSSGLKAALGRMSPSENSIIHTINDLEATIRRVHQAEVGQKFLDLVEKYPDPGIEVNKVQLAQRYNPTTGEVETYNKPVFGPEDTTFSGIKDGKHFYIRINDNPLLVRALKSDQIPQGTLEQLISRFIAPATRTIAGLVTKWSPSFAARNPIRDAMDAIQGVASETKAKMAAEAVTGIPQSAAAMYRYFRGRGGTGAYDRYAKEFAENGGMVGFYSGKDYDAQLKNLESMIRRESATGVRGYSSRTTKAIFDAVEDFTGAGENGTRLSVYKTLRENGWSVEDAVSYAKNITINFNRHGEHRWISQLYMFANPGIQGVKRFKDVVTTKKGAYIMGGITATALALAEANRMMGGQDEDGTFNYDKLSPFEKSRNLILMNPATGKPLVKIPLGFYARLPFAIANSVADVRHGVAGPVKFATNVIDTALDAFNPLGAGNTLQTFTPTIARPAVDIYTNKNFMGIPIKPEQPTFGPQKPESELYFKGVSPYSKAATQKLNELTGGNAMRSGFIDISPETVDYTVKFFTGGPGDTIYKMAALAGKFYDTDGQPFTKANLQRMWEETTAQEVPVVGGFTGAKTEHYYPTKFREASQEAEQRFGEYKWRGKTDQGVDEYAEKEGDVIGMGQVSAKYKSQIADINAAIKEIEADKTLSREEMRKQKKELEKEKEDLMKQYLKDYNEADKQRKAYKPKKAGGGI